MTQGEIVVLGLLMKQERYGYEIEKHIENNNMREWTKIGFSSIYSILNKLYKKELIDFKYEDEKDGPKRKVFFILDEGIKLFNETLIKMIKTPVISKQDVDVGIVFSVFIDESQLKDALIEHRITLEEQIINYNRLLENRYIQKQTVVLLFKRAMMHMQTDILWINEVLKKYD